jgi:hypothetical protein
MASVRPVYGSGRSSPAATSTRTSSGMTSPVSGGGMGVTGVSCGAGNVFPDAGCRRAARRWWLGRRACGWRWRLGGAGRQRQAAVGVWTPAGRSVRRPQPDSQGRIKSKDIRLRAARSVDHPLIIAADRKYSGNRSGRSARAPDASGRLWPPAWRVLTAAAFHRRAWFLAALPARAAAAWCIRSESFIAVAQDAIGGRMPSVASTSRQ